VEKTEHSSLQKVILDAGPIIHLDELGCLDLLLDFKELLVPEAVWSENEFINHQPKPFRPMIEKDMKL